MVCITGDIHGSPWRIYQFAKRHKLTEKTVIIILGDVGANYYGDERDDEIKKVLAEIKPRILCIHGNHEMRPWEADGYILKEWNGGNVWVQEKDPNIMFAKDGEIYTIEGRRYIAIGGAYSVDKHWRLMRGSGWWSSEQPTTAIKEYVEKQLKEYEIDIILSHTCPKKYIPLEAFLPQIDQSTVDNSTEEWLDQIESSINYKAWYCGHWHIEKDIDKIHFLYKTWHSLEKDDYI